MMKQYVILIFAAITLFACNTDKKAKTEDEVYGATVEKSHTTDKYVNGDKELNITLNSEGGKDKAAVVDELGKTYSLTKVEDADGLVYKGDGVQIKIEGNEVVFNKNGELMIFEKPDGDNRVTD